MGLRKLRLHLRQALIIAASHQVAHCLRHILSELDADPCARDRRVELHIAIGFHAAFRTCWFHSLAWDRVTHRFQFSPELLELLRMTALQCLLLILVLVRVFDFALICGRRPGPDRSCTWLSFLPETCPLGNFAAPALLSKAKVLERCAIFALALLAQPVISGPRPLRRHCTPREPAGHPRNVAKQNYDYQLVLLLQP